MTEITDITDSNFNNETKTGTVLIDFFGEWCDPCKKMIPVLEKVARLTAGRIKIVKADVGKNAEAVKRFGLRSVPSFALLKDGQLAGLYTGMQSEGFLLRLAEEN
jgi:thioredoxin 1